jgi:DNA-binding transcriptional LysR family regulator
MDSWLGVELRHLSALAAVAEEQSFRGAADRLGYVQSAVSQRIAQLELVVGARLVERSRGHRHVELTEAGHALLHHAERIQSQLNAARADLRSLTEEVDSPSLRVGVFGSLATRLLPQALALLRDRSPDLRVGTREVLSDADLFVAVQDGQLDAAFAELPLQARTFDWHELLVDPPVLLVPAGSPLAGGSTPPTLDAIAREPLVVDPTWRMFALIEAEFAAAGVEIDARFTASTNAAVQAIVAAGLGVAIVPRLAAELDDPATEIVELGGRVPARTLVCYWPRERRRSPALEAFLGAMDAVCAPLRETTVRPQDHVELAA